MFPSAHFPPKPSTDKRSLRRQRQLPIPLWGFAVISFILAGGNVLTAFWISNLEFNALVLLLPFGIAWSVCIRYAWDTHGRRAWWLLIGFPFAWLSPLILILYLVLFFFSLLR